MFNPQTFLEAVVANGPRPPGSEGTRRARSLLREEVQRLGLEAQEETFEIDYSLPRYSTLTSPGGTHRVLPAMWSADWPVEGTIRLVDTLQLDRLGSVEGQILIWDGFLERREEYLTLARSGARALVLAWADKMFSDYPWTDPLWKPWADKVTFPVASIGRRTACAVVPGPGTYRPLIESGRTESANVVWSLGEGEGEVYVLGHFDSLPEALGITDNACGVAVMLRVTELLAGRLPSYLRVHFVATTGHESHHGAGAKAYFERHHEAILRRGILAIQSDCQGAKLTLNRWRATTSEWCRRIERAASEQGLIVDVRESLIGHSETFHLMQVMPVISFWRRPFAGHVFFDDLSIVDFDQLEQVARAMAETIRSAGPEDADHALTENDRDGVEWYRANYGLPQPAWDGREYPGDELRQMRTEARANK